MNESESGDHQAAICSRSSSRVARDRFSRAAVHYDGVALIQQRVAFELAGRVCIPSGGVILDVGAGTGSLLAAINERQPPVRAVALDIAWGMVERGRRTNLDIHWLQADAGTLPFKGRVFDAVVSSSAYQWVGDLEPAFGQVHRVLKPCGLFYAAFFGRNTLKEFFAALESSARKHSRKNIFELGRLPSSEAARRALRLAGFTLADVRTETRLVPFSGLLEILGWLKAVGANSLRGRFFLGKDLLRDAEQYYREFYAVPGGLAVSFEIVWITAKKNKSESGNS